MRLTFFPIRMALPKSSDAVAPQYDPCVWPIPLKIGMEPGACFDRRSGQGDIALAINSTVSACLSFMPQKSRRAE